MRLDADLSKKIKELAMSPELKYWSEDLSLYNFFNALLVAFLHRLTGEERISVGSPIHNRPTGSLKETTGLFTEFFPLSVETETGQTFKELVRQVKSASFELFKQAFPVLQSPPGAVTTMWC